MIATGAATPGELPSEFIFYLMAQQNVWRTNWLQEQTSFLYFKNYFKTWQPTSLSSAITHLDSAECQCSSWAQWWDRQNDALRLHRPYSAYYMDRANNVTPKQDAVLYDR